MKTLIFFTSLIFCTILSCQNNPNYHEDVPEYSIPVISKPKLTGNPSKDLPRLFPGDNIEIGIFEEANYNSRRSELQTEIRFAIDSNMVWYTEMLKKYPNGKNIPYHPNFGVSKEDYLEYEQLKKETYYISSKHNNIKVNKSGGIISFEAQKNFEFLDSAKILVDSNIFCIGQTKLKMIEPISVPTEFNWLESSWDAYTYEGYNPNIDPNTLSSDEDAEANLIFYKATIARINNSGQVFMAFRVYDITNGKRKKIVDFETIH